jgi:putative transposase
MKTYEFRLYPNKRQQKRLVGYLDACRLVYNWALADRRDMWQVAKCSTNFYDQSKYLVELKKEFPRLSRIHVHALQTTLKRADLAFQAFFRRCKAGEKPGYPRFKGKDWFSSFSFKEDGNGFELDGKRLRLSRIGRVRIRLHRDIIGKVATCTIKRRADGWFALFAVETEPASPSELNNPVGVDMGLNFFAVLSTGEKIKNPRLLKKAQDELKTCQRQLHKKKNGSTRRARQKNRLARMYLKVQRCRKDFHNKVANRLVKEFNPIFVEGLDIKGLISKATRDKKARKRFSAKSENILDAAWSMFVSRLRSKAESAGSATKAKEARGTSQECSGCGEVVKKELWERIHSCPHCGLVKDRDWNAALNILNRGLQLERTVPAARDQVPELLPRTREATPL